MADAADRSARQPHLKHTDALAAARSRYLLVLYGRRSLEMCTLAENYRRTGLNVADAALKSSRTSMKTGTLAEI